MAQAYWQNGITEKACFSLFCRRLPVNRGFLVFAGLDDIIDYLEEFRFTNEDIEYLRSLNIFESEFLLYLKTLRFRGTVRAMKEGDIFFANEPVVEVEAPIIEAQIIETYLINQINVQSMLATKASRIVVAAKGRAVVDFASRRTQGLDSALDFAKLSYAAGFSGTSNVLAGREFGIPIQGTMAHSFINAFIDEKSAFRAYAKSFPKFCTFLVDTYDSIQGVKNAIVVAGEMRAEGNNLFAIRIDSGDLFDLTNNSRRLLDQSGFSDVKIIVSGGLDEFDIQALLEKGAKVDGFGVGTKPGVSSDAPWTDMVYKLVEYAGQAVVKLSSGKVTLPGPKQVNRILDKDGYFTGDILSLKSEKISDKTVSLLQEKMVSGERIVEKSRIKDIRICLAEGIKSIPGKYKTIVNPEVYSADISPKLVELDDLIKSNIKSKLSL